MDRLSLADDPIGVFPRGYTAPRTTEQLTQYHKDHATRASVDPIIPMDNIKEKLKMIEEIRTGVLEDRRNKSKDFQFTYLELAYFLLCSESSLRKVINNPSKVLQEDPIRDNLHRNDNSRGQSQDIDERIAQLEKGKKNLPQKNAEKEKCLLRDSFCCVFTQNDLPQVCQILPFIATYGSWTFVQKSDASSCFHTILGAESWPEFDSLVSSGSDRCDKSWNMISLGPDLRDLWEEHFFGIQCLGILPIDHQASAIWLQFHWMPRNQLDFEHRVELTTDTVQRMLQIIPPGENDLVEEYRSRTHRPLKTGHIFSIRMGKQDALSMKQVIDLRWLIVRIATISGLARCLSFYK
ncbi:hypothetical protein MKX08_001203 [Trichoderma sp. CBMAI-0020]|nr:hypothetical protein MKX08_001203 [Trichoderma sp. CBMAI-0020]